MRVAIASDIHGNKQAFEAVIAAAEDDGADELWCLGDLVGYGAEPDACVALADAHCTICLAGNHDLAVVDVLSLDDFSRGAALAAQWTKDVLGADAREYLLSLSPTGSGEGVGLFHASPRDPVWEYVLSALAAELCFDATDFRISFIGHSHVALSFHRPEGEPASGTTRREGDARAAWLALDTGARSATWRRADYDIAAAQAAIRAANLPDSLAERLQY